MSQIVKAHIFQALFPLDPLPHAIKLIGTPLTVASWLPREDHIGVHRTTGIAQLLSEQLGRRGTERHGSRLRILRFEQPDNAPLEIDLHST
jgi:hypothetical protein